MNVDLTLYLRTSDSSANTTLQNRKK